VIGKEPEGGQGQALPPWAVGMFVILGSQAEVQSIPEGEIAHLPGLLHTEKCFFLTVEHALDTTQRKLLTNPSIVI